MLLASQNQMASALRSLTDEDVKNLDAPHRPAA